MLRTSFLALLLLPLLPVTADAQNKAVDSILKLISKSPEDTSKVNLYRSLSVAAKFTDPALSIEYGHQGVLLGQKLSFDNGIAGCLLAISTGYIYADKLDTALLYLDTALVYAHKAGDPNRLGLAYLNRADIHRQRFNFTQSLKDCDTALSYADQANNDDVRARINQTIGAVYYRQSIYDQALVYDARAIDLYRKGGNMRMSATVLNNMGLVYKSTQDYARAISVTTDAIRITDSLKDISNLSIYNGNMCDIYQQMKNYDVAEQYAKKAMEYAVMQDNQKLVSIALLLSGDVYLKQKRFPEAIAAVNKALPYFKEQEDMQNIFLGADILAEAYALTGNYAKAYEYMGEARSANDSIIQWKYEDDLATMQTRFMVKEKDKEILLLAKDKELQRRKIQEQRLFIFGAIALVLIILGAIWLLANRNSLKQRMKELELRNRIAADLHDEVGSSLSSIHMLSQLATQQTGTDSGQKDILQRMSSNAKETMDKMSDIVWMIKPGESEAGSLKQRMERFAYEIGSNIEMQIDISELESLKLSMAQRKNIYLVFKEALNNALKYSGTDKLTIHASVQNKELTLLVKDEGKGFDSNIIKKGNGLNNMRMRAKELGGTLDLSSAPGSGTTIKLLMPV